MAGRPPAGAETGDLGAEEALREMVAGLPRAEPRLVQRLLDELQDPVAHPEARQELAQVHLALVLDDADARRTELVPVEDLFQEGSAALLRLIHGLDPAGPPSSDELLEQVQKVTQRAMEALLEEDAGARREDSLWAADAERLFTTEARLRLEKGADPTNPELAKALGWPEFRVDQMRRAVAEAAAQRDGELAEILSELEPE